MMSKKWYWVMYKKVRKEADQYKTFVHADVFTETMKVLDKIWNNEVIPLTRCYQL